MADPTTYRPAAGSIPTSPGVYKFRDDRGRVVYVGKAKNLRSRLTSYFQDIVNLHPRTASMVTTAAAVEWTVVNTEVEALQLEYSWIKEFDPRFNVKYRDDKSYPWLAVTLGEEFPRVMVGRGAKKRGTRYYGPYSHAWAIRETVDLLLRVFPMRSCSNGVFTRSSQIGRPCLLGYIGKCSAPCVGRVTAEEHRDIVDDFCDFMSGQTTTFTKRLEKEMYAASAAQDYERAARLRDDMGALNRALEKQQVVLGDGTDADVIAFAEDPLEVAVQIFYVRGGRIRGQRGWVADKVDDADTGGLVERFLLQLYDGEVGDSIPREVLVPALPDDAPALEQWLSDLRGSRVSLRVPQRGDKKALQETVARNALQALGLHKTKRASDLTTRNRALEEIQQALELPDGAAAHRVLRHLQPAGHRGGRLDGGLRGRPGPQERVPPLRDQGRRGPERRRLDARGDHPPLPPDARRARRDRRGRRVPGPDEGPDARPARCWSTQTPAGRRSSPTRPGSSSSTAARPR